MVRVLKLFATSILFWQLLLMGIETLSLIKFCVLLSAFLPQGKKRKVLMSLKPLKPKHRQYPSYTAVSHVTAVCDWAENTSVSVYVCLCVISEYDWAAACAPSVRAHAYDLSLFFVSAMQSRREKRSILTSLFPGRLILFFQIRALTGFWYCILMWFRSGLSFFLWWYSQSGIGRNGLVADVAHMGGAKQRGAVATKQVWTNNVDSCPAGP